MFFIPVTNYRFFALLLIEGFLLVEGHTVFALYLWPTTIVTVKLLPGIVQKLRTKHNNSNTERRW